MLRPLYDRAMALASGRHAEVWLGLIAFAESSFFPLPPDLLLMPMCVARPRRAWRYAAICTAASVAGGMLGYAIGFWLQPLGIWLLRVAGHAGGLAEFQRWYAQWGVWIILIKGFTPIPYKLVTIASGLARFSFPVFVAASVATRGGRFFLTAGLLRFFGEPVRAFVERRLTLVAGGLVLLAVAAVVLMRLLKI